MGGGALFSVFFVGQVKAYGVETHGFLSKEVIDFYNKHNTNKLSADEADYLVDGSMHEDTHPRFMNHFYDPVNNRGLADGLYKGQSAKRWAQDEELQKKFVYKILARAHSTDSILSATQIKAIQPTYRKTNFTWQKAVDLYAKGEKEQALFAFGHVLHLIEDSAVPDHVRNDSHPDFDHGGSPYENWTKKFNLENPDKELATRLSKKNSIILDNLDEYFDGMANYANNNFYSRDSINKYELPKPDFNKRVDGKNFLFKKDVEFGDYELLLDKGDLNWKKDTNDLFTIKIHSNYWNRLSVKAIQHGAGLVTLFFKEAEMAKADYELEKAQRPYLGTLIAGFTNLFGGSSNDSFFESPTVQSPAVQVNPTAAPLRTPMPTTPSPATPISTPAPTQPVSPVAIYTPTPSITSNLTPRPSNTSPIFGGGSSGSSSPALSSTPIPTLTLTPIPTPSVSATLTPSPATPTPTPSPADLKILINEIQVGGQSAGDEFIELYNPSNSEVDLSSWSIQYLSNSADSVDSTSKKNFESGNIIKAKGYFLITRAKNSSGSDGYTGSVLADLDHRSFSLSGASIGGKIFLVNDQTKIDSSTDPNIVDQADYSVLVPENGKSIERDGNNWKLLDIPTPQNSQGSVALNSTNVEVVTGLKSIHFFQEALSLKKYLKLDWETYPFIKKLKHLASDQESPHNWGVVLFYLNQAASKTDDIFWSNISPSASYNSWGLQAPNGLKIEYANCMATKTKGSALIFPANTNDCLAIAGNYSSYALDINGDQLEDNSLLVEVSEDNFAGQLASSDYLTVSTYAYQPGYEPNNSAIRQVVVDPNKYYFDSDFETSPPSKPSSISFDFDSANFKLKLSWGKSTDPDSPDSQIAYYIKYNDKTGGTKDNNFEIVTEPNKEYSFEISAVDELGNLSEAASTSYLTPDVPLPYKLTKVDWNSKLNLEFSDYPFINSDPPSSEISNGRSKITAIIFFLNQDPPENYEFLDDDYRNGETIADPNQALKLSYLPCDYGRTWTQTQKVAGVILYNDKNCPKKTNGLFFSSLSLANIASISHSLSLDFAGQFTNQDYITLGFYELGERNNTGQAFFKNIKNYLKKIYFSTSN